MANVEEARIILKALGLPPAQSNEMSALTLLSLCGLGPDDPWSKATRIRCTEAKKNNEAARLWISGIEALQRVTKGRATVYDLSATPFFLRGSGSSRIVKSQLGNEIWPTELP